jgi:hypothetical protein
MTVDDNDLKTFRRYSRQDAAALLNAPDSWLKTWVTDDVVPHQRSGKPGPRQRGVWFTYDDILAIGKLMPSLMTARQANKRAEARPDPVPSPPASLQPSLPVRGDVLQAVYAVSDVEWDSFGGLTSLRA